MNKIKVAVVGAGGKMGTRTSNNLAKVPEKIELICVENSAKGIQSIHDRNLRVTPMVEALAQADVVVFAVPDTLIKAISKDVVPLLKKGSRLHHIGPCSCRC